METSKYLIKKQDIKNMAGDQRTHFLNANAVRLNKSLGDVIGLKNMGIHQVEVEPGFDSTEYHIHFYEEEAVYILAGTGLLRIENETHEVEAGDFFGFPAGEAAHDLKNTGSGTLVFLVMGQRLDQDVADYPDQKKRLYRNNGVWDLVDKQEISDPKK